MWRHLQLTSTKHTFALWEIRRPLKNTWKSRRIAGLENPPLGPSKAFHCVPSVSYSAPERTFTVRSVFWAEILMATESMLCASRPMPSDAVDDRSGIVSVW